MTPTLRSATHDLALAALARDDAALVEAGGEFRRAYIAEMTAAPVPALPPTLPRPVTLPQPMGAR